MTGKFDFKVAVVGAGPAGLMAAEVLAAGGVAVTVYDRMAAVGRKFLLAGPRRGSNLDAQRGFRGAARPLRCGDAAAARRHRGVSAGGVARVVRGARPAWTFVGSSGRVFPASFKASPLLRAWLRSGLGAAGVSLRLPSSSALRRWQRHPVRHAGPRRHHGRGRRGEVLALGGAGWPRLGSDGGWVPELQAAGVAVAPLRPANCGFVAAWTAHYRDRFQGMPLKTIAVSFSGKTVRSEAVITSTGLEGGAIYRPGGAGAQRHRHVRRSGRATSRCGRMCRSPRLTRRLAAPRGKQSLSTFLRKFAGLSMIAVGLLVNGGARGRRGPGRHDARGAMAGLIAALPVRFTGTAPLAPAISTAGGIMFDALDDRFMLRHRPRRVRGGRDAGLGGADRRLSAAGRSRPAPRPDAARSTGCAPRCA